MVIASSAVMTCDSYSAEGGELFDRVVEVGKFTEPVAKLIFYQLLMAVQVCRTSVPYTALSLYSLPLPSPPLPFHLSLSLSLSPVPA